MLEEQFQRLHQMIQKKESTSENVEKEKEMMTKSLTEVDSAHIARDSREKSKLRWGWDVVREQHRNMYIIYVETDHQPRLVAWDKCLGLVHWEDPEGSGREGRGRKDQDGEYM